jgi:zinc protease
MTSTLIKFPRLNSPKVHRLPNGLTIISEQMPVDAVNLSLWVNVGSATESDEINGMAHFLEHMVFKGTPRLEIGEFERRIEERGAVTNAATSQDYTHYYITSAPSDFAKLVPLQIDVVLNASITDDAFERERFVVLEEIRRSEDNPGRRTFQKTMQTVFERLPYRRPVLGPEEVIANLRPQQMRDFHGSWYQPKSMTAVAVGNLPADELIETIADSFDVLTSNKASNDRASVDNYQPDILPELPFTEIVRHESVDNSLQQARLIMTWRSPGMIHLNNTYGLDVLAAILGQGRTSRLVRDLREERGLVSNISVSHLTQKLQGTFYIAAYCAAEDVVKVEAAIIDHIRRLQTELVDDNEIARVRKRVANRFIFSNEKPSDRAGLYGYYHTMMGDLEPAFSYARNIQSQDADDLMLAAHKYLSPDAYGVVVIRNSNNG